MKVRERDDGAVGLDRIRGAAGHYRIEELCKLITELRTTKIAEKERRKMQ